VYYFGIVYIGLIIIFLPFVVAIVFEKQKRTNTKCNKANKFSKESKHLCPIRYLLVLFQLDSEGNNQNYGYNNTQHSHYKPEFAHLLNPFYKVGKSIIRRLKTKCKQNHSMFHNFTCSYHPIPLIHFPWQGKGKKRKEGLVPLLNALFFGYWRPSFVRRD
jgi:hypothetical protein